MFESLIMYDEQAALYVLAMDQTTFDTLVALKYERMVVLSLKNFEDFELLKVKETRTRAEYCWTCTPSIIKYCVEEYGLDSCTYLDADLYFYSNPSCLLSELGEKSVSIIEHRYTPKYDQSKLSGKYCVQFMTFKNDSDGLSVLNWWRKSCLNWCYARAEDGKFGDQKYLDDWLIRFQSVYELQNIGGGVAPWNVGNYNFKRNNNGISVSQNNTRSDLIFYHFHGLKIYQDKYDFGFYEISKEVREYIYLPYLKHLEKIGKKLEVKGFVFNWSTISRFDNSLKGKILRLKRLVKGNLNVYTKEELGIYG